MKPAEQFITLALALLLAWFVAVLLLNQPSATQTTPPGDPNPKCTLQVEKCARLGLDGGAVDGCRRDPTQHNASNAGCLGRRTPRYDPPPAWLWRLTVRWTA